MKKVKLSSIGAIISISAILIAIVSYAFLPEKIVISFNVGGQAAALAHKLNIFLIGAMPAAIYYGLGILRVIDPKKENYRKFETVFQILRILTAGFILVLEIVTIVYCFYPLAFNVTSIITTCTGLLICVFGNYMPKLRHNFFCGIRTPWTLASEECWVKTHRLAGKVWFCGGAALALSTLFLKENILFYFAMGIALIVLFLVPCIYSYFVYAESKRKNK